MWRDVFGTVHCRTLHNSSKQPKSPSTAKMRNSATFHDRVTRESGQWSKHNCKQQFAQKRTLRQRSRSILYAPLYKAQKQAKADLLGENPGQRLLLAGVGMAVGSRYGKVPRTLHVFCFLIWVLITMSSVCEIHQPVRWCSELQYKLILQYKGFFFFYLMEQHLVYGTFSIRASFLFWNDSIINLCKRRNHHMQIMSLMRFTHRRDK